MINTQYSVSFLLFFIKKKIMKNYHNSKFNEDILLPTACVLTELCVCLWCELCKILAKI